MNMLTLSNVSVTYEGKKEQTITDISCSIKKNTMSMLIGPNGSGKSTLLKAILGIIPYTGTIKHSADKNKVGSIGYVPQRFAFDFSIPLTVKELLFLALTTCHHTPTEKQSMIDTALEMVHAQNIQNHTLGSLSGGQLQRILLARALVHDPSFLILDEPEAGIDVSGEHIFYDVLRELATKKKKTILIASHELELVHAYADHVICLNRTIHCSGKPEQVLTADVFQNLYNTPLGFYKNKL